MKKLLYSYTIYVSSIVSQPAIMSDYSNSRIQIPMCHVYSYRQLLEKLCRIANVLRSKGVKKGDVVAIYMPVCPLAVASMLACARIGAVHRYICMY